MHTEQKAKRRLGWWLVVALALLTLGLQMPADQAMAAGYPAHGWQGSNGWGNGGLAKANPPPATPPMMWIVPEGSVADVICREYNQLIYDATMWNFLRDSNWGQSSFLSSLGYTLGSSGIPSCSALTSTRETRAVEWAKARIGQTTQPDGNPWNDWCDRFVANAFGMANSGYETAYDHWLNLASRGLVHPGDRSVPLGALAFYSNRIGGHVMISEGNGSFVSTGPEVYETGFSGIFGSYLGWAYANPEWPGV